MKLRLMYRGVDAIKAIKRFDGYLPKLLKQKETEALIKLFKGVEIKEESLKQKLVHHHIIKEIDGQLLPCIPVLTTAYSEVLEKQIQTLATQLAVQTEHVFSKIASKLGEKWDEIGHVLLGQLVIGNMWYKAWQEISKEAEAPTTVLIADPALTHMFYAGVYPLTSNEAISYWQTTLLGNPDRVYDILHNKDVIPTLQSINERFEVVIVGNALPLMLPLKMYKSRRGENGMPVQYIDLPRIDLAITQKIRVDLKQLCKDFYKKSQQLETECQIGYEKRPPSLKAVRYHDFRQMVYLVFSYVVVEHWLQSGNLPQIVPIKGANKKQTQISVDIKL